MPNDNKGRIRPPIDRYPWRIIFIRWALLTIEASIGLYFVMGVRMELGVMFLAYGVVCLFLLLPLIRCVRCSYYGRRCNFGWGVWVSKVFSRDETHSQSAFYGYTILFWPLRLFPLLLGFAKFLNGLIAVFAGQFEQFRLMPHGLYLIYLTTLWLHRRFYRAASCSRCHEQLSCPVYNSRVMLTQGEISGRIHRPQP
ncbi:MAG: hypothetical protein A2W25_00475 [candidate division Zixibacteria bacterium RBG_16_53_22]|nr:MAG: hypothetical protein A2W25_00475 [candidate division Zixibacteria bacterium RBG_16_53_22]